MNLLQLPMSVLIGSSGLVADQLRMKRSVL